MEEEIWKDVVGFEGYYQVSNTGKVLSLRRSKLLKPKTDKDGYFEVVLCVCNERTYKRVHRLVAEAFIPNEEILPLINHKDSNKQNNTPSNLEWCSPTHNIVHAYKNNKHKRIGKGFCDLTNEQLKHAVELFKNGFTYKQLNEYFSLEVDQTLWSEIFSGRRYSEITCISTDIRANYKEEIWSKVTKDNVFEILSSYHVHNVSQTSLCEKYKLSPAQVSRIVNGTRRKEEYKKFMSNKYV